MDKITWRDSDIVISDVVRASHPNLTDYSSHFVGRWCRRVMNLSITIGLKAVQPQAMKKETNWIRDTDWRDKGYAYQQIAAIPCYFFTNPKRGRNRLLVSVVRVLLFDAVTRAGSTLNASTHATKLKQSSMSRPGKKGVRLPNGIQRGD